MEHIIIRILCFIIGIAIGNTIQILQRHKNSGKGVLHIDTISSDSEDHYNLDIGDLDALAKKKQLILKIDLK